MMENFGGFNDTGDWKLIISVSKTGMSGFLKRITGESSQVRCLFSRKWDFNETSLLKEIENTVYDNPGILDDFATELIVDTPEALWFPTEAVDDEDKLEKYFCCIYECEEEDIFTDRGESETCGYTLTGGLQSFLMRTLPGCKITSRISVLKNYFEGFSTADSCIYANINKDSVDIIAFKNGKLLTAASHDYKAPADIAYKIFLLIDAFCLEHRTVRLSLLGIDEYVAKNEVKRIAEKSLKKVEMPDTPPIATTVSEIKDLALLLSLENK